MNEELNALADLLHDNGWTSPNDAQWTRLDDAIPSIRELLSSPAPAPVAVPDEKPLPDLMMASYHEAIGWNACRAAMLAAAPSAPASQTEAQELATLRAQLAERDDEIAKSDARLHEVAVACATAEEKLAERDEAVIAQAGNVRALADALKTLTQAARISGGVAGADSNLMAACDKAENALSLTGVGCAVNAVLDVLEERDQLTEKLAASEARVVVLLTLIDDMRDELYQYTEGFSILWGRVDAALSQPKGDSNDQAK